MAVTYDREMRDRAQDRRNAGLITLAWTKTGVGRVTQQGPATAKEIAAVERLMTRINRGAYR